jgi:hypothetical protein
VLLIVCGTSRGTSRARFKSEAKSQNGRHLCPQQPGSALGLENDALCSAPASPSFTIVPYCAPIPPPPARRISTEMQTRMPRVGSCRFVSKFVCVSRGSCHVCVCRKCVCVSCVSGSVCLTVFLCVFMCHGCRVSCVSRVTRVRSIACHACRVSSCLDRLRFGSCPCQVLACLRLVFVSARPCAKRVK